MRLKLPGAGRVPCHLLRVLAAVHLDDQSGFSTGEVCDVAADRMLAPELEAECVFAAQDVPQARFSVRRLRAKVG